MRKPLLALAVSAFGIGTTEFVIMGLLPDLARDLHVSILKAGTLVSGYALSVTVGSPVVALAPFANGPEAGAADLDVNVSSGQRVMRDGAQLWIAAGRAHPDGAFAWGVF